MADSPVSERQCQCSSAEILRRQFFCWRAFRRWRRRRSLCKNYHRNDADVVRATIDSGRWPLEGKMRWIACRLGRIIKCHCSVAEAGWQCDAKERGRFVWTFITFYWSVLCTINVLLMLSATAVKSHVLRLLCLIFLLLLLLIREPKNTKITLSFYNGLGKTILP